MKDQSHDCITFSNNKYLFEYLAGDENYFQIFTETHLAMTLLDCSLQTFNDDVVKYVLSLNLPFIYDRDDFPIDNLEPGQQYMIKCYAGRRRFHRIERINPWTPISKSILRGNLAGLQIVCEKYLGIQKKKAVKEVKSARAENNAVKRSCSDNIAANPRAYAQGTWEATRTAWTGTETKTA